MQTVRDPAQQATEGLRVIAAQGAEASYQIALLTDGRYALKYSLEYKTGDYSSHSSPWHPFDTREECVEAFVAAAKRHFTPPVTGGQVSGQKVILDRLEDTGLFGFTEPLPVPFEIQREVQAKLDTLLADDEEG